MTRKYSAGRIRVSDVIVGERVRMDLGDIETLAESMAELGLLQPIVVTPDRHLIAGERRLTAARRLKWEYIPAQISHDLAEQAELLAAEGDENTHRKPFSALERLRLAQRLRPRYEAAARGGALEGRVREQLGRAVGWSDRTVEKALAVADAAESDTEHPSVRQAAAEALDYLSTTGKVDPAYQRLRRAREALEGRKQRRGRSWGRERISEALEPVVEAGLRAQVAAVEALLVGPDGLEVTKAIRSRSTP